MRNKTKIRPIPNLGLIFTCNICGKECEYVSTKYIAFDGSKHNILPVMETLEMEIKVNCLKCGKNVRGDIWDGLFP